MRCKLPIGIQTFSPIREEGYCYRAKVSAFLNGDMRCGLFAAIFRWALCQDGQTL